MMNNYQGYQPPFGGYQGYQQQFGQPMYQQGYYGNYPQQRYNLQGESFKMNQPLAKEEAEFLQNKATPFTLSLTKAQMYESKCTHKSLDGTRSALEVVGPEPERVRCSVCGETFLILDPSKDAAKIEDAAHVIHDAIETAKFLGVKNPDLQSFNVIAHFVYKIPQFLKQAEKQYDTMINGATISREIPYGNNNMAYDILNRFTSYYPTGNNMPYSVPMNPMGGNMGMTPSMVPPTNAGGYGAPQVGIPAFGSPIPESNFAGPNPVAGMAGPGINPFGNLQQQVNTQPQVAQQNPSINNKEYAEFMDWKNKQQKAAAPANHVDAPKNTPVPPTQPVAGSSAVYTESI